MYNVFVLVFTDTSQYRLYALLAAVTFESSINVQRNKWVSCYF